MEGTRNRRWERGLVFGGRRGTPILCLCLHFTLSFCYVLLLLSATLRSLSFCYPSLVLLSCWFNYIFYIIHHIHPVISNIPLYDMHVVTLFLKEFITVYKLSLAKTPCDSDMGSYQVI